MSYDDEEVLSDSGFNPNSDSDDLDDDMFDEPLEEEADGFKFDEEEPEAESI
jgi:hypothetical protein